jgi:hypothetical protein
MPIRGLLASEAGALAPEEIEALTSAFEEILHSLGLTDREDSLVLMVAKLTIESARQGERSPTRLREAVLKALLV